MTKQEQIEEMRKEIENGFRKADCRQPYTNEPYPYFETQKTAIAKALYNAGYRKVDRFEAEIERLRETNRQLNTDYNRSWERLKSDCREIAELKAENEQLKEKLEKNPLAIKQKIMEEDDYELTEREQATLFLDRMESDVEILHDIVENLDELLGKGIDEYIKGIDGVEGLKDMWERSAVSEFAGKLKEKYSLYDDRHILYRIIDELLKEYE